jgi:hypothetical protein
MAVTVLTALNGIPTSNYYTYVGDGSIPDLETRVQSLGLRLVYADPSTFGVLVLGFDTVLLPFDKTNLDELMASYGYAFSVESLIKPRAMVTRVIAFGATVIGAGLTVDLVTAMRNPEERVSISGFVAENVAGLAWGDDSGIEPFFARAVNANEFTARARNLDLLNAMTFEWTIIGTTYN